MNTRQILTGVGVLVVLVAIVGAYVYPKSTMTTVVQGVSTAGSINTDAKLLSVSMAPLTNNGTSTSVLNDSSQDRMFTDYFAACEGLGTSFSYKAGAGIANLTVSMSTSSSVAQVAQANTSLLNIATATPQSISFSASSTAPAGGDMSRVWGAGTYEQIVFNATNTASCQVGGKYLIL